MIVCDDKGTVHVVYGKGDQIFYLQSTDGGTSFSKPISVSKVDGLMLGMRRGPRIAVSGDILY